jgi:arylsulfatase A-like enzyme
MPTVPARRSILTGRRVFPFRGWRPQPELGVRDTPGWAPIEDVGATFTSALRRAGWWTGYVTDNPFLGFAKGYAGFRSTFDRFVRVGGQIGTIAKPGRVSKAELDRWLVPELREPNIERRVRHFLAAGGRKIDAWFEHQRLVDVDFSDPKGPEKALAALRSDRERA